MGSDILTYRVIARACNVTTPTLIKFLRGDVVRISDYKKKEILQYISDNLVEMYTNILEANDLGNKYMVRYTDGIKVFVKEITASTPAEVARAKELKPYKILGVLSAK